MGKICNSFMAATIPTWLWRNVIFILRDRMRVSADSQKNEIMDFRLLEIKIILYLCTK